MDATARIRPATRAPTRSTPSSPTCRRAVPLDNSDPSSARVATASRRVLPDGRIITSLGARARSTTQNEQNLTAPDFGIYNLRPGNTRQNQLVYNDRNTWDLNADRRHRRAPSRRSSATCRPRWTARSRSASARSTSPRRASSRPRTGAQLNNTALSDALKQAVAVRVIEGFSSEAAKGVEQVRPDDARRRRRPRNRHRLRRRQLARQCTSVHSRCTSSRSTSSA